MPRTVDPEKHLAQKMVIVDAALTCFASTGYAGTSTAAICRQAGIGSGTFFHYFPTKLSLLLAILAVGTDETREWFAALAGDEDPRSVLDAWLDHTIEEMSDPRVAGFVRAVGGVMGEPEVEAALALDDRVLLEGLEPWMARAQVAQQVRADLSARHLTSWVLIVLDGFLSRLAADPEFTAKDERATLRDVVRRVLAPASAAQDEWSG